MSCAIAGICFIFLTCTTRYGNLKHFNVGIGISPHEVAQEPLVRDVSGSSESTYLVQPFAFHQLGGEAAVTTENLLVHQARGGQIVEALYEGSP